MCSPCAKYSCGSSRRVLGGGSAPGHPEKRPRRARWPVSPPPSDAALKTPPNPTDEAFQDGQIEAAP
eukprot:73048-Alexandrium_andersonii.AAC.1